MSEFPMGQKTGLEPTLRRSITVNDNNGNRCEVWEHILLDKLMSFQELR